MTVTSDNATRVVPAHEAFTVTCNSLRDLLRLDEPQREEIMRLLRAGLSLPEVRRQMSERLMVVIDPKAPLMEFYTQEAQRQWQHRYERASVDVDAIKSLLKKSKFEFTDAILEALGQETFRLIVREGIDADKVHQFIAIILRIRDQQFAREKLELRHKRTEKLARERLAAMREAKLQPAMDALYKELDGNETALGFFEQMCAALDELSTEPEPAKEAA